MFNRKIRNYLVSYVWYGTTAGQGNMIIGMHGRFRKRYAKRYVKKHLREKYNDSDSEVVILNHIEKE